MGEIQREAKHIAFNTIYEMTEPKRVLAFDIGIRNLAWCLMEKGSAESWTILGWENYDLLAGSGSEEAKQKDTVLCATCSKKASYLKVGSTPRCAKHCEEGFPPFRDLSGNLLKKIPGLKALKEIATVSCKPLSPKIKSKVALQTALEGCYSMPLVSTKATRVAGRKEDVANLHNAIQVFVEAKKELFRQATHIFLENQPAFKNPTMKTVQILVFATLRERLRPAVPWAGFVHAGKKVQGKEVGDKGYTSRKKGSEDRTNEFLKTKAIVNKETWINLLAGNHKKSDMCDALCMCLDQL